MTISDIKNFVFIGNLMILLFNIRSDLHHRIFYSSSRGAAFASAKGVSTGSPEILR
jgi:hypothetical protein